MKEGEVYYDAARETMSPDERERYVNEDGQSRRYTF